MGEMTKKFLREAFAGESMAHMKYLIFAEEAEKRGKKNLAKLFRAIAYAEFVHARNHLRELGGIGDDAANLQVAIDGETFEVEEMYPVYHETAKMQGEKGAQMSTKFALEAEKIHAQMYKRAKDLVEKGQDYEDVRIYICPVCGYTTEGERPQKCPVCGVSGDKFVEF